MPASRRTCNLHTAITAMLHVYECLLSRIWMSHVARMNASCCMHTVLAAENRVLQRVAECRSGLQCVAERCSVLQRVAECRSGLQCVAERCSVLQCVAECCSALQCVAVCCSVLQCVAVCCSVLQCVAVCCNPEPQTSRVLGGYH